MTAATQLAAWRSGQHVGARRPVQRVEVRLGHYERGYDPWSHGTVPITARIWGESRDRPWQATWVPRSDWAELPNVLSCDLSQDFGQDGLQIATLELENILYPERVGVLGILYHLVDRGALSPYRGYHAPGRPKPKEAKHPIWYQRLVKNAQIKVFQGYGTAEPAFVGLIDDVDETSRPDRISVVARDHGQVLSDSPCFGWNKSKQLPEPVVFEASGPKGDLVGHGAAASSARRGHPPRFAIDKSASSRWISANHDDAAATEWLEIRLPRGRYEGFAIHNAYPGMEMFVGIYARSTGLGGELAEIDNVSIDDGWIYPSEVYGGAQGMVPGEHGGWPYVKRWSTVSDKANVHRFGHVFELGDDSVMRVAFRRLALIDGFEGVAGTHFGTHRAGVVRVQAIKQEGKRIRLTYVGRDTGASSSAAGHLSSTVVDNKPETRWESQDHPDPAVTEWVEIKVPKGRYDTIALQPAFAGMDLYIGVYARQDGRGQRKVRVDGLPVDEGWVARGFGLVPGENGGWNYSAYVPNVDALGKTEVFSLGARYDLGDDSVIRVGFRNLASVGAGNYRAGVVKLKARTRSGVRQPPAARTDKVIEIEDVSDIVRIVLRWAGFKEWNVESVGASVTGSWRFNRSSSLMDVIKRVQEVTGYVFFIGPPSDASASLGIPTFRSNSIMSDALPVQMVTDADVLTGIQARITDKPLDHIIRVRGDVDRKEGLHLGSGLSEKRIMAVYRPPWTRHKRLAGVIRHFTHTEKRLNDQAQVEMFARLVALRQALESATATIEIPGVVPLPGPPGRMLFELDSQIALVDRGTGLNTRLYVARRTAHFTAGEDASFKATIGGSLLDTPDIVEVKEDIRELLAAQGKPTDRIALGDAFSVQAAATTNFRRRKKK